MDAVRACDFFLPSQIEAAALAGTTDLRAAAATFLGWARGGRDQDRRAGCLVATREHPEPALVPTDVVEPVDSTGAGDAFCGAFAAEHLRSGDSHAAGRRRSSGGAHRRQRSRHQRSACRGRNSSGAARDARIAVINPNTSAELTAAITAAAQAVAGAA